MYLSSHHVHLICMSSQGRVHATSESSHCFRLRREPCSNLRPETCGNGLRHDRPCGRQWTEIPESLQPSQSSCSLWHFIYLHHCRTLTHFGHLSGSDEAVLSSSKKSSGLSKILLIPRFGGCFSDSAPSKTLASPRVSNIRKPMELVKA